ncbi:MAG: AglZ/HisF2 family acetamidino modification protein [Gammaproteobacteria bacterium]
MLRTRVMPCLLLHDGALVKTVRYNELNYIGDPINAVRIFNEFEVDELIFLDISASQEKSPPPFQIIEEIAGECFMPVTYGGGIGTIDDISRIHNIGIEKVAINTTLFSNSDLIKESVRKYGSQSIVASIDVKRNNSGKHSVYSRNRKLITEPDPVKWAQYLEGLGAGEILLTSVDNDGTWSGYDIEILKEVTCAVDIPVIACGGAGDLNDFNSAVKNGGASAVAAGSLFVYQKKDFGVLINYPSNAELEDALHRH